ncbi:unnamed protein product, partial [Heterosigma akashiwo]
MAIIIHNNFQAKAGVSRVNRANGAGVVALFLNNSDLAEEGGSSCPAESMIPGDVVAFNEAALESVPLSVDALAAGAMEGGVMDQCESEPPPEGTGDGRVGQGHGLTDRSGLKPVTSSWACAGANAGLVPKRRKGTGTFLDQVVVEGFMKMF